MVRDRRVRSPAARAEGRQPSRSATSATRATTASVTMPRVAGFSARETVEACTPAARATSAMVARGDGAGMAGSGERRCSGMDRASWHDAGALGQCNRLQNLLDPLLTAP